MKTLSSRSASLFWIWCLFISFASSAQTNVIAGTGQYFTSFDNTKIYYEVNGTGQPVLLIHGFTNTSENWKKAPVYQNLIKGGFKVIIVDLRGNGKSDKPHTPEAYANDAEAKDLKALLKHLKIKKYAAVGYSRGSIIAARLLVLDKNSQKIVLGGMGADFTNPEWPRRILFYRALSGEPVPELEGFIKSIPQRGLDQVALAYQQKGQPSTAPAALSKVKKPVLVISGDIDQDNGSAEELAKLIPKATVVRVPGDHNNTMRSVAFSDAVLNFLK